MATIIRFSAQDFEKLHAWFPDSDDGILDVDEVLEACEGHGDTGEILRKATRLQELGFVEFQAGDDTYVSLNDSKAYALLDQIREDCTAGDTSDLCETLSKLLITRDPACVLENYLRESTLTALNL